MDDSVSSDAILKLLRLGVSRVTRSLATARNCTDSYRTLELVFAKLSNFCFLFVQKGPKTLLFDLADHFFAAATLQNTTDCCTMSSSSPVRYYRREEPPNPINLEDLEAPSSSNSPSRIDLNRPRAWRPNNDGEEVGFDEEVNNNNNNVEGEQQRPTTTTTLRRDRCTRSTTAQFVTTHFGNTLLILFTLNVVIIIIIHLLIKPNQSRRPGSTKLFQFSIAYRLESPTCLAAK